MVFVGEVRAVGKPPSIWRSRIAAYQRVEYRVVRTIEAPAPLGETVAVLHPMVWGAPISDPQTPRLRPELFRVGARFVIRARRRERDGELVALERDGAMPAGADPA